MHSLQILGIGYLCEPRQETQSTLDGVQCIWMINTGLITYPLAVSMIKETWLTELVLLGVRKIQRVSKSAIHYYSCEKHVLKVAATIGATSDQLQTRGNNLRQFKPSAVLHTCGVLDKAPHIYTYIYI